MHYHTFRLTGKIFLLTFAWSLACGQPEEEVVQTKKQAQESMPCEIKDLTWEDNNPFNLTKKCSGSWEYQVNIYKGLNGENLSGTVTVYSGFNKTLMDINREISSSSSSGFILNTEKRVLVEGSLKCTTCEDVVDPRAKFDCLWSRIGNSRLPEGDLGARLKEEIIKKIKILFELRGNDLFRSEAQPDTQDEFGIALATYKDYPTINPSCGGSLSPELQGKENISWLLGLCKRMSNLHVSNYLRLKVYPLCQSIIDQFDAEDDPAKLSALQNYIIEADKIVFNLLISLIQDTSLYYAYFIMWPQVTIEETAEQLRLIEGWYDRVEKLRQKGEVHQWIPAKDFEDKLDWVSTIFWKTLYQAEHFKGKLNENIDPQKPIEEQLKKRLSNVFTESTRIDQKVLAALVFSKNGKRPMSGASLFKFMGDALDGLVRRLDRLSMYHDVACVLSQCSPVSQRQTALSTLWTLLALLPERTQFEARVKAAKSSPLDLNSWPKALEPFIGLQETMIKTMEGLPRFKGQALIDSLDMVRLPRPFVNLVRIIKLSQRRYHNMQTHGQFTLAGKELFQPLHESSRDNVKKTLTYVLNSLDDALLKYDATINNLLQTMIQNNDFQANKAKQDINQATLAAEIAQLQKNLGAHLQSYERESDDLDSEVSKAFQNIKDSISAHDLFVDGGGFPSLMLSGDDARFTGQTNISEFAVDKMPQPLALSTGQILQVNVSGQWSPTCSLRAIHEIKQGDTTIPIKAEGALTGPGGFYLSKNSSGYTFKSGSQQETTAGFFQAAWRKCAGGPDEETLTIKINGEQTTYCQNPQMTKTTNEGESSDSHSIFAYNSGWKMPGTPIPEAPVGSLVLVMMPKGEKDIKKLKAFHIAREPSFSFPIDEPVDIYFVVNDRTENCQKDSAYTLTLNAVVLDSQKENARRSLSRMSCILKNVRDKRDAFIKQGELLASDKEVIKIEALNSLGAICSPQSVDDKALGQIPLSAYHSSLMDAFRAMLEKEILHLERAVRIENLKHSLLLKQYEQQVIKTEKNNALVNDQISAYMMKQNIANIDTDYLYHITGSLTKILVYDLIPMIKLWYPEILSQGGISSKTHELSQLQTLDLNANLKEVAKWMKQIAKVVESDYTLASMKHFNKDISASHTVILRIPREADGTHDGLDTTGTALAEFLRMDKESSQLFWQAVEHKKRALLTLGPNDIYRTSGTNVLGCFYELPILRTISLVLVFDKDMSQYNSLDRWIGGASNMHQRFTTRGGLVNFDLNPDAEWKRFKTPLYYATPYNITTVLKTTKPQDIIGLSPFSSLEIKFDELDAALFNTYDLSKAKEILMVLELEGYKTTPPLTWIESCANAS